MIQSAKYDQFGNIIVVTEDGTITASHEESYLVQEFQEQGGTIEPAEPIDYTQQIKDEIFRLLRECDWIYLDEAITPQEKATWQTYRAALRQVEMQIGRPFNEVIWPNKPEM